MCLVTKAFEHTFILIIFVCFVHRSEYMYICKYTEEQMYLIADAKYYSEGKLLPLSLKKVDLMFSCNISMFLI